MRLQSIKYSQFDGQPNEWNLDNLDLLGTNLIVGRNASGKTKILNCLNLLARLLCGEAKPNYTSAFDALFEDPHGEHFRYKLKIEKKAVVEEIFLKEGKEKQFLVRGPKGEGEIYIEKEDRLINFQSPDSELAFFSRRDSLQHSYFEPLYKWAKSVHHYSFGTPLGRETFSTQKNNSSTEADTKNALLVVDIYRKGEEKLGNSFKEAIIEDLKQINYDVSDIGVKQPSRISLTPGWPIEVFGLWVKEKDLECETEQFETSQGMFRAISLIIQLNYLKLTREPSCILIDDIGEGLDYERSCHLIKLIMDKAENASFQLIMATNDRFVMNYVPLEYWTVLQRDGKRCQVFNIRNSKEKFEEFRFTGLNNFDFFASDYLIKDND